MTGDLETGNQGGNQLTDLPGNQLLKWCLCVIVRGLCLPGFTLFRRSSFSPVSEAAPAGSLPISSPRFTTRSFSDTMK